MDKRSAYGEFEAKRREWIESLSGQDRHSISRQLCQMIWDAAVYRVINEARRLAPKDDEGRPKLNGAIHALINRCFFISQATALRRLLDRGPKEGPKGVRSLYGLLDDMQEHAHLMTRENIFKTEGLPYDYEPTNAVEHSVSERLAWHRSKNRHVDIDRLSAVEESHRAPNDGIRPEVFEKLKDLIGESGKDVKLYVDKFIAHAATSTSRAPVGADEPTITLGHLWDADETICKIAAFVAIRLLGDSWAPPLPTPQYDQFEYIEQSLVDARNIGHMVDLWQAYDTEVHNWGLWGLDEFEGT